jgi:hypothetical protein
VVSKQVQWNLINVTYAIKYSLSGVALSDTFVYIVKRLSDVRPARKLLPEVTILTHTEECILGRSHIVAIYVISVLHTEGRV